MFEIFPKIPRLAREVTITEKIDGTAVQVHWMNPDEGFDITSESRVLAKMGGLWLLAGSRNRYIVPSEDHFGFAAWVESNADELFDLGPGRHYGEWWGSGIQRGYGLDKGQKRFSLFNTKRWQEHAPACCQVVPVLDVSPAFYPETLYDAIGALRREGSQAAPGYMNPEGIVIWHKAAQQLFKYTLDGDGHKS